MMSRELLGEYWYCMKHWCVEKFQDMDSANRIGLFLTEDAVVHAFETIREREKVYEIEDFEWDGDD